MFKRLKKKKDLKKEFFKKGYEAAAKKFERERQELIERQKKEKKNLKTKITKIIKDKNEQIKGRDRKIKSIRKYLFKMSDTIGDMEAAMLMIQRDSKIELLEIAEKSSKDLKVSTAIHVLCRDFNKIIPKIEKSTEEYTLEFLN